MQNELNVQNVATRRKEAREWARATGELPRIESPVSGWRKWFTWETLTVAGRTVEKGWVVPQPLGIALIVVMLGGIGWAYRSSTEDSKATLKAMTRIETLLDERTTTFKEQQAQLRSELETERRVAELQREKQRDEIRDLKASLPQKRNRQ
jgi:hypothetical protein